MKAEEKKIYNNSAIAVIGMACRFPMADSVQGFWELLKNKTNAITDVPAERWEKHQHFDPAQNTAGKMYTKSGGFLHDIDKFDAAYFGILPREANELDPQHRILLETSVHALEDAGLDILALKGTRTGVFVGISNSDYAAKNVRSGDFCKIDPYSITGTLLSSAAGRISYTFGFEGPTLAIDTACSSSLVSIHYGVQSLRLGESDISLAGGVNCILTPEGHIGFSQLNAMSPDGKCKAFDESADGYVRSEGCGIVVLKRLDDAIRDNDNVLAVIRGSAINHDGRSKGFTVPRGKAQEKVMRYALQDANILPEQVGYVETHGTGTQVGDRIEARGLHNVYGTQRDEQSPLIIGAVKTNIGHAEAAAGIAGFIKTVLVLNKKIIPPNLHFNTPSHYIAWDKVRLKVPTELQNWNSDERKIAAVSSFGITGTNAHIILEEPSKQFFSVKDADKDNFSLLTISAKSDNALAATLANHLEFITKAEENFADICYTSNVARPHYEKRIAISGTKEQIKHKLAEKTRSVNVPYNISGEQRGIVFLFTGQGSQYHAMGKNLFETQPVFQSSLLRCEEILRNFSITELLYDADENELINQTRYAQPLIFSIQYALAELWKSWGIVPSVVLGHSIGSYAAACIAGSVSLEDGLALIAERGRLMQGITANGAMACIFANRNVVEKIIIGYTDVAIAVVNSENNIVISGETSSVEKILSKLAQQNIRFSKLNVSHAFHSALMEPVLNEFRDYASGIKFSDPVIPFLSDMSGKFPSPGEINADYWTNHIRQTVLFADSVREAHNSGYKHFLEIGPTATLTLLALQNLDGKNIFAVSSLCKDKNDTEHIFEAIASLYEAGFDVDWKKFYSHSPRKKIKIPCYPFQRKRYWVSEEKNFSGKNTQQTPSKTIMLSSEDKLKEILSTVISIVSKISGIASDELNTHKNVFELGLDSLVLIQIKQAAERALGVEIPISRFYDEAATIHGMSGYIARNLPEEEKFVHEISAEPLYNTPKENSTEVEKIIAAQLELMAKQLELLRGGSVNTTKFAIEEKTEEKISSISRTPESKKSPPESTVFVPYRKLTIEEQQLCEQQQKHITTLSQEYSSLTTESKNRTQKYRDVFANNRNVAGFRPTFKEMTYQIIAESAQGSKIRDVDGREYIDLTMGFGVYLFGHNAEFIRGAIAAELDNGTPIGPMSHTTGEISSLIHEMTGAERCAYFNSGTEAVMVALRLARTVTGRKKIAIFSGSYHGTYDGILALSGDGHSAIPLAPGIPQSLVEDVFVLNYGDDESLNFIRENSSQLAAVLVEPVQSRRPDLQPKEFLHKLRKITEASGTALIFDEVITGFRIGSGGAQAYFDIQADIVTYGKIIGGGMPIGIVAGKKKFLDAIDGGFWSFGDDSFPEKKTTFVAGTFCHHPLAMAATKAVLKYLKEAGENLYLSLNQKTERLCDELNKFFSLEKIPISVVHFASLFRFVMGGDFEILFHHLAKRGIYVWEGRNCFLSTAHSDEDIEKIIVAVKESIAEMRDGGFFPEKEKLSGMSADNMEKFFQEEKILPLSSSQEELWYYSQSSDIALSAYSESVLLRMKGEFMPERMKNAVKEISRRHELLRVTKIDGRHQYIAPEIEPPFIYYDPQEKFSEEKKNEWLENEAAPEFNFEHGHLWRVSVVKEEKNSFLFVLTAHHIIADGWSLNQMILELQEIYNSLATGRAPVLPDAVQFDEYQRWLDDEKTIRERTKAQKFWKEKFSSDYPELNLPKDLAENANVNEKSGGRVHFTIADELSVEIKKYSRKHGISHFMFFLGAYKIFLQRLCDQAQIAVGVPAAGQALLGAHALIGQCSAILPIISKINPEEKFSEFLLNLKRDLLDVYDNQNCSFAELLADDEKIFFPQLHTTFNIDRIKSVPEFYNAEIEILPAPIRSAKFDFCLNILEVEEIFYCDFDYNSKILSEEIILDWKKNFLELLSNIVINRKEKISEINSFKVTRKNFPKAKKNISGANDINSSKAVIHRPLQTNTEKKLAEIWKEILGKKIIDSNENFLNAGGHSLKATQLCARIAKTFDKNLGLKDIFLAPTLAAQAALIDGSDSRAISAIQPVGEKEFYDLSHAQKRFWLMQQIDKNSTAANLSGWIMLEGDLNSEALKYAFDKLIARHEILRTTFEERDGLPKQIVHKKIDFSIRELFVEEKFSSEIQEWLDAEAKHVFDLTQTPLFRIALIRTGDVTQNFLALTMHHIISDGWSMQVLLRELAEYYSEFCDGKYSAEKQLRKQYKDFAAWQNQRIASEEIIHHKQYWKEKFSGEIPLLNLPGIDEEQRNYSPKGTIFRTEIASNLTAEIEKFAAKSEVTSFAILLSCINILLYRLSGQEEIVVGVPVSGRDTYELEDQIGLYLNILPMRNFIPGDDTFREVLNKVNETALDAFEHQIYPYDMIVQDANFRRVPGRNPLFDVGFTWDDTAIGNTDEQFYFHELTIRDVHTIIDGAMTDLWFYLSKISDKIELVINYKENLFEEKFISKIAENLKKILEQVTFNPEVTVGSLVLNEEMTSPQKSEPISLVLDI